MSNRSRTIWYLLIIFTILSLLVSGFVAYPINSAWSRAKVRAEIENFGTDEELEGMIEFLEQRLEKRNEYQFTLEKEPMRLINVVFLDGTAGMAYRTRNKDKVRVTAIVDGKQLQAIVQYDKKNYTVAVGDSIAGGEIVWIDREEVVLLKGDKEVHYQLSGLFIPTKNAKSKN